MRMWDVIPDMLCKKHLMQEHASLHAFASMISKGKSVQKFVDRGHCECKNILHRHNVLAREMLNRGINHRSPMSSTIPFPDTGSVDIDESIRILKEKCSACSDRHERLRHTDTTQ